jgi:hypothetical protein
VSSIKFGNSKTLGDFSDSKRSGIFHIFGIRVFDENRGSIFFFNRSIEIVGDTTEVALFIDGSGHYLLIDNAGHYLLISETAGSIPDTVWVSTVGGTDYWVSTVGGTDYWVSGQV